MNNSWMIQIKKTHYIYRSPWGHNIILADLTIKCKGTIITIWGLQGYNNNNKGDTLTKIRDYTSDIGT